MNVKYAVLLGFMIGLANMIPYIGAIVAVVIAVLITLLTGGLSQAIWATVVIIILQQIDANIINLKITGSSLEISFTLNVSMGNVLPLGMTFVSVGYFSHDKQ